MTGYILPIPSFANLSTTTASKQIGRSQAPNLFEIYRLQWRRNVLWVSPLASTSSTSIKPQRLVACLQRSAIRCVCIDPAVGKAQLKTWADACAQVGKPLYLRVPNNGKRPDLTAPVSWRVKRVFDWLATLVGTAAISPLLLLIAALVAATSSGPVFYRQWRVGYRGRLYRVWKFRTMVINAETLHYAVMGNQTGLHKQENDPRITPVGRWLRKYSLDELPQLFNVLRGEMSLVGPRPWALYDALRIPTDGLVRLRAMPGITGEWQVTARSTLLDLAAVTHCDLTYLNKWSIGHDLRLLCLTFPKVIVGFGAH